MSSLSFFGPGLIINLTSNLLHQRILSKKMVFFSALEPSLKPQPQHPLGLVGTSSISIFWSTKSAMCLTFSSTAQARAAGIIVALDPRTFVTGTRLRCNRLTQDTSEGGGGEGNDVSKRHFDMEVSKRPLRSQTRKGESEPQEELHGFVEGKSLKICLKWEEKKKHYKLALGAGVNRCH